ncbi:MAG: hypothetical protein WCD18_06145 [Thermosynechococcaceae cyanobacterium]
MVVKTTTMLATTGGSDRVRGLGIVHWFDFDAENNIPTYYSVVLLFISAFILWIISAQSQDKKHSFFKHWRFLSLFFLLMSLDEAVGFHENLIEPTKAVLHLKGVFSFAWIVPALFFVIAMAIYYIPFLKHLPSRTRKGFLLSAAVYLSGVFVLEALDGAYLNTFGQSIQVAGAGWHGMIYAVLTSLEEFCEFSGIIIFIGILISYLQTEFGPIQISFLSGKESSR